MRMEKIRPTKRNRRWISKVDGQEYSEEEEQEGEDDEEFFKRLENMVDVLSVEDQNSRSATDDIHEGEEPAYQMHRSGHVIRALKRDECP
jgi:hypothetical protein